MHDDSRDYGGGVLRFLGIGTVGAIGVYAGLRSISASYSEVSNIASRSNDPGRQALIDAIMKKSTPKSRIKNLWTLLNDDNRYDALLSMRENPTAISFVSKVAERLYGYHADTVGEQISLLLSRKKAIENIGMTAEQLDNILGIAAHTHDALNNITVASDLPIRFPTVGVDLKFMNVSNADAIGKMIPHRNDLATNLQQLENSIKTSFVGANGTPLYKPSYRIEMFRGKPTRISAAFRSLDDSIPSINFSINVVNDGKVLISPDKALFASARKILYADQNVMEGLLNGYITNSKELYSHIMSYDTATVKLVNDIVNQAAAQNLSPLRTRELIKDALSQASPGVVFSEEGMLSPNFSYLGISDELDKLTNNQVFPFAPHYDPDLNKVTVALTKNPLINSGDSNKKLYEYYNTLGKIYENEESQLKMHPIFNTGPSQVAKGIFADFREGDYARELYADQQIVLGKRQQRIKSPFVMIDGEKSHTFTMQTYMGDEKIVNKIMREGLGLPETMGEAAYIAESVAKKTNIYNVSHIAFDLTKDTAIGEGLATPLSAMIAEAHSQTLSESLDSETFRKVKTGIEDALLNRKIFHPKDIEKNAMVEVMALQQEAYKATGKELVERHLNEILNNSEFRNKIIRSLQEKDPSLLMLKAGSYLGISHVGSPIMIKDRGQTASMIAAMDVTRRDGTYGITLALDDQYQLNIGGKLFRDFKSTVRGTVSDEILTKVAAADYVTRQMVKEKGEDVIGRMDNVFARYFKSIDMSAGTGAKHTLDIGLYKEFKTRVDQILPVMEKMGIEYLGVEGRSKVDDVARGAHNIADIENLFYLRDKLDEIGGEIGRHKLSKMKRVLSGLEEHFKDYLENGKVKPEKFTDTSGLRQRIDEFYEKLSQKTGVGKDIVNLIKERKHGLYRLSYTYGLPPESRGVGGMSTLNHYVVQMHELAGMSDLAAELIKQSNMDLRSYRTTLDLIKNTGNTVSSNTAVVKASALSATQMEELMSLSEKGRFDFLRSITGKQDATNFVMDIEKEISIQGIEKPTRFIPIPLMADRNLIGTYISDEGTRILKPIDNAFHRIWVASNAANRDEALSHAISHWYHGLADIVETYAPNNMLKASIRNSAMMNAAPEFVTNDFIGMVEDRLKGYLDKQLSTGTKQNSKRTLALLSNKMRLDKILKKYGLSDPSNREAIMNAMVQVNKEGMEALTGSAQRRVVYGEIFRHPTFSPLSVAPTKIINAEKLAYELNAIDIASKYGVTVKDVWRNKTLRQKVLERTAPIRNAGISASAGKKITMGAQIDYDADVLSVVAFKGRKASHIAKKYFRSYANADDTVVGKLSEMVDVMGEIMGRAAYKIKASDGADRYAVENFGRLFAKGDLFSSMIGEQIASQGAVGKLDVAVSALRFGLRSTGMPKEDVARLSDILRRLDESAITARHGRSNVLEDIANLMESLDMRSPMKFSERRGKILGSIKSMLNYEELSKNADYADSVKVIDELLGKLDQHLPEIFEKSGSLEQAIDSFAIRSKNRANPYQKLRQISKMLTDKNVDESSLSALSAAIVNTFKEGLDIPERSSIDRASTAAAKGVSAALREAKSTISGKWIMAGLVGLGAIGLMLSPGDPESKIQQSRDAIDTDRKARESKIPRGIDPVNPPKAYMMKNRGGRKVSARVVGDSPNGDSRLLRRLMQNANNGNMRLHITRDTDFNASRKAAKLLSDSRSYRWNQQN